MSLNRHARTPAAVAVPHHLKDDASTKAFLNPRLSAMWFSLVCWAGLTLLTVLVAGTSRDAFGPTTWPAWFGFSAGTIGAACMVFMSVRPLVVLMGSVPDGNFVLGPWFAAKHRWIADPLPLFAVLCGHGMIYLFVISPTAKVWSAVDVAVIALGLSMLSCAYCVVARVARGRGSWASLREASDFVALLTLSLLAVACGLITLMASIPAGTLATVGIVGVLTSAVVAGLVCGQRVSTLLTAQAAEVPMTASR